MPKWSFFNRIIDVDIGEQRYLRNREKLIRIEAKVDDVNNLILTQGRTMMTKLQRLYDAVAEIAEDTADAADDTQVAIDLIKELVKASTMNENDPQFLAAMATLEEAHLANVETSRRLKDTVGKISVSGGLVTEDDDEEPVPVA